jgi:hypothetical protein
VVLQTAVRPIVVVPRLAPHSAAGAHAERQVTHPVWTTSDVIPSLAIPRDEVPTRSYRDQLKRGQQ